MNFRRLNTLAIGDLYIPCGVMREAILALEPSCLDTVEWHAESVAELQARLLRIESEGLESVAPPDGVWSRLADVQLLMTHLCPLNRKMIDAAPHLRVVALCRGGTDSIDVAALREREIQVFNAPSRNANAVAEMTVALMLAESRNIARGHASMINGGWRKSYSNEGQPTELRGKMVGLIGFGNVGRRVARIMSGFGVQLVSCDPSVSAKTMSAECTLKVEMSDLLRTADFISLHARCDSNAPPMIGPAELQLMKSTAYLINTARARLIDEQALAIALRNGQIAGAALDVFQHEPLPADSPLRFVDNITLTPHIAGSTFEAWRNAPGMIVDSMMGRRP